MLDARTAKQNQESAYHIRSNPSMVIVVGLLKQSIKEVHFGRSRILRIRLVVCESWKICPRVWYAIVELWDTVELLGKCRGDLTMIFAKEIDFPFKFRIILVTCHERGISFDIPIRTLLILAVQGQCPFEWIFPLPQL